MATLNLTLPIPKAGAPPSTLTVNRNYLQAVGGFITPTYGRREQL